MGELVIRIPKRKAYALIIVTVLVFSAVAIGPLSVFAGAPSPYQPIWDAIVNLQNWLKGNVTALRAADANLQGQINALTSQDLSILAQIAVIKGNITTLKAQDATLQSQIDTVNEQLIELVSEDVVLQGQISDLQEQVEDLQAEDAYLQGQINALNDTVELLKIQIVNLEDQIIELGDADGVLQGQIDNLQDTVASLTSQIEGLIAEDLDLQGQIDTLGGLISDLQAEDGELQSHIETLQDLVGDLQTEDTNLHEQITSINGQLTALEAKDTDLQNQINNIQLIQGPQGPQGEQGPVGPAGQNGTCTCDCVSQADYDALVARVEALEGTTCFDADHDNFFYDNGMCPTGTDCDDTNPNINPGVSDIVGNNIDDDCDGVIDEGVCTDNILLNPGFEEGIGYWSGDVYEVIKAVSYINGLIDPDLPASCGSHAAFFSANSYLQHTFTITNTTLLHTTLTFDIWTYSPTGYYYPNTITLDVGNTEYILNEAMVGYHSISIDITEYADSTPYMFRFTYDPQGTMFVVIDNVKINYCQSPPTCPHTGLSCDGPDADLCTEGTYLCDNGLETCSDTTDDSVEVCGNSIDDDCDGQIDEGCNPTTCVSDTDCQAGYYCSAYTCVPKRPNGAICSSSNACLSGYCADGFCCNSACNGACDSCSAVPGTCSILSEGNAGSPSCTPYVCNGLTASCPTSCTSDSQCSSGTYCDAGSCVFKLTNGYSCAGNSQCLSSYCVDGFCCNSQCNGLCEQCDQSGLVGTCSPVPAGTDPDNECSGTSTCSGAGTCTGTCIPNVEVCDGCDNNCDGTVDNVDGIGSDCNAAGINTIGACTAAYVCPGYSGPGPNGLTCVQVVGPSPEVCNGIDDDCNGAIDDNPIDVGGSCNTGLYGVCSLGTTVCVNGNLLCVQNAAPSAETCNGLDDNCDGQVDEGCPPSLPASCLEIFDANPFATSGAYELSTGMACCDMSTQGGGWTCDFVTGCTEYIGCAREPYPEPPGLQGMLDAQNAYRAAAGVGLFLWSDALSASAQDWANTIGPTQTMAHRSPVGPPALAQMIALTYSGSVPAVVDLWASSQGHLAIMVDSRYNEVGCGIYQGSGYYMWVCDYGWTCLDQDGDGYYGYNVITCPSGTDCNDLDNSINPSITEACDGEDNNCNGMVDEGCGNPITCTLDTECVSGYFCGFNECQLKQQLGESCTRNGECLSGSCADGVCCNSLCNGLCEQCNQFGLEGICSPIPEGIDPYGECGGLSTCSGAGTCSSSYPEPEALAGITAVHNTYRWLEYENYGVFVPFLTWSNDIASNAQAWANTCPTGHNPARLTFSQFEVMGWGYSTPQAFVDDLANQQQQMFYNHEANYCPYGSSCANFAAVVESSYTEIGCGVANCGGTLIWVCNYN